MSLILRPYQTDIISRARDSMSAGSKSILICAPTGSGKTALTAHMLATAASKSKRSLFLVHRRELIKQSIHTFSDVGVKHGVISSGWFESDQEPIQIASVQSYARRMHRYPTPDLIIWDECHHLAAGSWASIYQSAPKAYHVGLTATPERLDGKGLGNWFNEIIQGPTTNALIREGYLSPYRLIVPPGGIQTAGIHKQMGDFNKTELMNAADKPTITGDAVKHYMKFAIGKRAVVFCVSIQHSKHVVSKFQEAGISAAHVDGETNVEERDEAIRAFEAGDIKILSNVELFGEGFDLPAIEAAILLRPTQSLGLYLQQVGRALRTSPGKDNAIIIDHADNCRRHGLPDQERGWSLEGFAGGRKSSSEGGGIKICPQCFAAQLPGSDHCRFCKVVFALKPREVEEVSGDLVEVDIEKARVQVQKRQEQGRTETVEDLIALGKRRGYKNPYAWAKAVFNARQAKRLAGR